MTKVWDDMLKRIFTARPQDFVQWLLPFAVLVNKVPLELKNLTRTITADSLYKVLIDGQEALLHVEFQRRPSKKMAKRLWEYNVLATLEYGCPVYSFVIYLTKGGKVPEPPLIQGLPGHETIHVFRYWNIKLWEVPVESLKQEGLLGLRPLCLLAQGGNRHQVAEEIFDDLVQEKDLLGLALAFAALVFDSTADEEWLERKVAMFEDLISDSPFYQRILRKGKDEGRKEGVQAGEEKGVQKALRAVILDAVRTRFPDLLEEARGQVGRIQDPRILRLLNVHIVVATSREEAERYLRDPEAELEKDQLLPYLPPE